MRAARPLRAGCGQGGLGQQGPACHCRHGRAGLVRSAALGVHLGFREGFGGQALAFNSSTDSSWCGVGYLGAGVHQSPWYGGGGGMQDEPLPSRASQPVSCSVSPRRATASSSGGTSAGASRGFTAPAERPAMPGQVGALPSPGVPVSPRSTRLQRRGPGLGGFGKPQPMLW